MGYRLFHFSKLARPGTENARSRQTSVQRRAFDTAAFSAISDDMSVLVAVRLQEPILQRLDRAIDSVRVRHGVRTTRQQVIREALDRHLEQMDQMDHGHKVRVKK